jgi:RsiW-degrading membrane proteinase PrsW (M82 family)
MSFPVDLILIALPTWLYAWLVRRIDRYEHEPVRYLLAAFLWGAVPAVVLGVIIQVALDVPVRALLGAESVAAELVTTAVFAPVSEEILKGAAVALLYLRRRHEFDGWIDGIVYGSTVGFGFAFVENIGYLAGTSSVEEWWTLYFLRVLVFGFMHGFWTSLTGIGFGLARNRRSAAAKVALITGGLLLATLGHVVHNASMVLAQSSDGATMCLAGMNYFVLLALMIGLGVIAGRRERALMRAHLQDEAPDVLAPAAFAALVAERRGRSLPRELVQAACELALAKRRAAGVDEIERLREKLRARGS